MKYCKTFMFILVLQIWTNQELFCQSIYKVAPSEIIAAKLSGTSTLHDWTMSAATMQGNGKFVLEGNELKNVNSLNLSLVVRELKSNEKMMDKNAYKALKFDQFKNIIFKLTSATVGVPEQHKYPVKAIGNLSIAGVTKPIAMTVFCEVVNAKTIACTAAEKLKMTDFQVKPPTFFFGKMKTGDELTIDFNLLFKN